MGRGGEKHDLLDVQRFAFEGALDGLGDLDAPTMLKRLRAAIEYFEKTENLARVTDLLIQGNEFISTGKTEEWELDFEIKRAIRILADDALLPGVEVSAQEVAYAQLSAWGIEDTHTPRVISDSEGIYHLRRDYASEASLCGKTMDELGVVNFVNERGRYLLIPTSSRCMDCYNIASNEAAENKVPRAGIDEPDRRPWPELRDVKDLMNPLSADEAQFAQTNAKLAIRNKLMPPQEVVFRETLYEEARKGFLESVAKAAAERLLYMDTIERYYRLFGVSNKNDLYGDSPFYNFFSSAHSLLGQCVIKSYGDPEGWEWPEKEELAKAFSQTDFTNSVGINSKPADQARAHLVALFFPKALEEFAKLDPSLVRTRMVNRRYFDEVLETHYSITLPKG
jgi:hypothetical protein